MNEKKLTRKRKDKKIAGVCAGIADYSGLDVSLIRVLWVLSVIFAGSGLIAYLVCALIIPQEEE